MNTSRELLWDQSPLVKNVTIQTDPSGDVTTMSGSPISHNPIDIISIEENESMSLLNVTFAGVPASGSNPGWLYYYSLNFDKDHDNSSTEYHIQFTRMVSNPPSAVILRDSDGYYWNGTAWTPSSYFSDSFAYITGNSIIFNFSSCPILIGNNWYYVMAQYTDMGSNTYMDLCLGDVINGPSFFAGQSGPDSYFPTFQNARTVPSAGLSGTLFTIKANLTDPSNVSTVIATIQCPDENFIANITLFDDGLHNDGAANDMMFANTWNSSGHVNGTYYIDLWANDTLGNAGEYENVRFFIIGEANRTGIFDGLYITWTGDYNVPGGGPWNGSENYYLHEGNIFLNTHQDSRFGSSIWYTDNATRILNTGSSFWGNNVHDHMYIPTTTSINDTVMVNFQGTDRVFQVADIKYMHALGTVLECWELLEEFGLSILYYETTMGLLIDGTFDYNYLGYYYSILINSTNAEIGVKPVFTVIEPKNATYYYSNVPLFVSNSTPIETMWYRNSTDGVFWSNNRTISFNGTYYFDASNNWADGNNVIQIFANNSLGYVTNQEIWFSVDTYGPWIDLISPKNTTFLYRSFPIILCNYTEVDHATFRYDSGNGWTSNFTLSGNGTHFFEDTISWPDGYYHLQVFANDSTTEFAMREVWFRVIASYPLNISHDNGENIFPKIILSAPGAVHIFWSANPSGIDGEILYDNNLNGHFGNTENITNHPQSDDILGDVCTDSSGNTHLVWMRDEFMWTGRINLYYSNNIGGSFSVPTIIPSPDYYNIFPSIVVDSNGIAHVAWAAYRFPDHWDVLYSNNTGGTFNTPVNISSDLYNESSLISMAIDGADVIHLAYMSDVAGDKEIMYQNISNGVFSTPFNISRRPGFDITPSIAVNSTGTVHIVWRSEGSSTSESEIFYVNNAGGSFSAPHNVSQDNVSSDVYPCIKLDETPDPDVVFISWSYNTTYVSPWSQMQIVIINNTLGTFGEKTFVTLPHRFVNASHLAVDPVNQQIHIVWMQSESALGVPTEIFYTYLNYSYPLNFLLVSPQNATYNYQNIPILVLNNTPTAVMWYRNNSGSGWSANQTLSYNGSHFVNQSTLTWTDGTYHIQLFGNDSFGIETIIEQWFMVDTQAPLASQWTNLTAEFVQTGNRIWINGSAYDPLPSSGLSAVNIFISGSNTSATWSANIGSATEWAFYNLTNIQENAPNEFYEVQISVVDNAGNVQVLIGNISVDSTPPTASQSPSTILPQNVVSGLVWVNGSAIDYGTGLKHVQIIGDNVSGGTSWSLNLGTNSSWSFTNTSTILDTPTNSVYEVLIQVTDLVDNTFTLTAHIIVDTTAPTGTQYLNTTIPQNGGVLQQIWVNGTAVDMGSGLQNISIIGDNITGGTTWSLNLGTNSAWAFTNSSPILDTPTGYTYEILVMITDQANNSYHLNCYIVVDTAPPNGTLMYATFDIIVQTTDINGRIWINGSAWDLGVGLQSVSIIACNVTGGADWFNAGTLDNWAFYNITPIPEALPGYKYAIEIEIIDLANNRYLLIGYIAVDFSAPNVMQAPLTITAQAGATIWVNGTAIDAWVGVQEVSLVGSNVTSPVNWTTNLGTNETWSFRNTSVIIDGIWEVIIQATDELGNSQNTTLIITVDNSPPTIPIVSLTLDGSNITLSWLPVFDLTSCTYLIYQDGLNIANTTSLYYQLYNLAPGEYTFSIRAMDSIGHIGAASTPTTIKVGGGGGTPLDPLQILIIILIGAAVGLTAGVFTYRRGRGGLSPLTAPHKPLWVSLALGYTPEFEEKLGRLSSNPQYPWKIKDQELIQFLNLSFTAIPGSIIAELDRLPIPELEKIEIFQSLLILSPERRIELLMDISEDLQEASM